MKKFILLITIFGILSAGKGYCMYDFCESPADYNTFPQAYDVRTEYWTDIPDYHPDDIKFNNMKNEKQTKPTVIKDVSTKNSPDSVEIIKK